MDPQTYYTEVGGISGLMSNYVYSATNVRLQELSVGYSLPAKWFNNKCNLSLSITGHNLWMIYNKAPFDPKLPLLLVLIIKVLITLCNQV